jgi:signal transduction histidine kinase
LAITKAVVVAHHGTVTAASTPGSGSTFTVLLPRRGDPA